MKNLIMKGFVCLFTMLLLCGGFSATAIAPKQNNSVDYTSTSVVTRDDVPFSIKESKIELYEKDFVSDHIYKFYTSLANNAEFYISGTIKLIDSNVLNAAPIFNLRNDVAIIFSDSKVFVGRRGAYNEQSSFDFNYKIGEEYNVVIRSSMTDVSLWVDGVQIIDSYELPYAYCGKATNISLKFPKSTGYFKNISIWSDFKSDDSVEEDIEFGNEVTPVDVEKSNELSTEKVVDVKTPVVDNNIWIAVIGVVVAIISVLVFVLWIVLKQRRAKK